LLIEAADRRLSDSPVGVIDERETTRAAGFPVNGQDDLGGFPDAGQVLA